jgi:hypothetical protein
MRLTLVPKHFLVCVHSLNMCPAVFLYLILQFTKFKFNCDIFSQSRLILLEHCLLKKFVKSSFKFYRRLLSL